jgi:hypothetical protein
MLTGQCLVGEEVRGWWFLAAGDCPQSLQELSCWGKEWSAWHRREKTPEFGCVPVSRRSGRVWRMHCDACAGKRPGVFKTQPTSRETM